MLPFNDAPAVVFESEHFRTDPALDAGWHHIGVVVSRRGYAIRQIVPFKVFDRCVEELKTKKKHFEFFEKETRILSKYLNTLRRDHSIISSYHLGRDSFRNRLKLDV